jgi:phage-related protein
MPVRKVLEFIASQPEECQAQYLAIIERLEQDGFLIEPFAKKIEKDLFEMRVRRGRQIRVFYYYDTGDTVIGIHAFVKKTQKTPEKELRQARKVISAIKNGVYHE